METQFLAIVGLPGSGKTEAVNYLKSKYNWPNIYLGEATFDRLKEAGLETNPENEKMMREKIREEKGMAAYAELALPKIEALIGKTDVVIIESLYSWEEYLILKEKYPEQFKVLAIYASPKTRISRLTNRPTRPFSPEECKTRDYKQIENLHQAGPIARAEATIVNEFDKENLYNHIEKILEKLALR